MIKIGLLLSFIGCVFANATIDLKRETLLTAERTTQITTKTTITSATTTASPNTTTGIPTTTTKTNLTAKPPLNFSVLVRDFSRLIPFGKIEALGQSLENDTEFQAALGYLASPEWRTIVDQFAAHPSFTKVWNVLRSVGFPFEIQDLLCREEKESSSDRNAERSLEKYIEGLHKLLPCEYLKVMFQWKMENDENFKMLHKLLSSKRMEKLSRDIIKSEEFVIVVTELNRMDVPVNTVIAIIFECMGWKNPPRLFFSL